MPQKAHVRNGQAVLAAPTERPHDAVSAQLGKSSIRALREDDGLTDEERAELHEQLEASIAEADEGKTEDFANVLLELRRRH